MLSNKKEVVNFSHKYKYHIYYDVNTLTQEFLAQWRQLDAVSAEPNFYLSQDYIIPSIQHLTPEKAIVIIAIEAVVNSDDTSMTAELIALGVFESKSPSMQYPFPHLVNYMSIHSLLGGFLIHKSFESEGFTEMISAIQQTSRWQLIELSYCSEQVLYPYFKTLEKQDKHHDMPNISWHYVGHKNRAILKPEHCGIDSLRSRLSKKRQKDAERKKRRLHEQDALQWRWVQEDVNQQHIDNFLELERQGWKADTGLKNNKNQHHFFLDVCDRTIKENKLFFTELQLGQKTIASTCNFIQQHYAFAFKVGRDAAYDNYGVGYLNEYESIQQFSHYMPDFKMIDSGAEEGSWIEKLWPDNYRLMFGVITLNKYTHHFMATKSSLALQKRGIQKRINAMVSIPILKKSLK